jgi:hypothetical protein
MDHGRSTKRNLGMPILCEKHFWQKSNPWTHLVAVAGRTILLALAVCVLSVANEAKRIDRYGGMRCIRHIARRSHLGEPFSL